MNDDGHYCTGSLVVSTAFTLLTLPRSEGHPADWVQACKGGKPASSSFDCGAQLCEFILRGNVALCTRKLLQWYAPTMKATNAPAADRYLREPSYRNGWELPVSKPCSPNPVRAYLYT